MRAFFAGAIAGSITAGLLGWAARPGPPAPVPAPEPIETPRAVVPCPVYQPVPAPSLQPALHRLERDLALLQARLDVEIGTPLHEAPGDDAASVRRFFDGLDLGPYALRLDCTDHPCLAELSLPRDGHTELGSDQLAAPWIDAIVTAYPGARTHTSLGTVGPEQQSVVRLRASVHTAVPEGAGQEQRLAYRWVQFERSE